MRIRRTWPVYGRLPSVIHGGRNRPGVMGLHLSEFGDSIVWYSDWIGARCPGIFDLVDYILLLL